MMRRGMIVFAAIVCLAAAVYAEETKQTEAKGLDAVTDAAGAVVTKTGALLSGNLEITMSGDKDKYANARDYTLNSIGQKVPKSTILKSGQR